MCTQTTIRLSFFEAVHGCSRKVNFDYFIRDPNAANKQVCDCAGVCRLGSALWTFSVLPVHCLALLCACVRFCLTKPYPAAYNIHTRCCHVNVYISCIPSLLVVSYSCAVATSVYSPNCLFPLYVHTGTQRVQSEGEAVQERGRGHPPGRGHGHHDAHAGPGGGGRPGLSRGCVNHTVLFVCCATV
jgi:hypothetical protein